MEAAIAPAKIDFGPLAARALRDSARLWFLVAALGQWAFAIYVTLHYGTHAAHGDLAAWNKTLPLGYVPGEPLILLCGGMAWRLAVKRDFAAHRAWAIRLFLAVNGVWFFRVGLMLSFMLKGGPFLFDMDSFTGPFLSFLGFAQYGLALLMALGIFGAVMGLWLPRITPLPAG